MGAPQRRKRCALVDLSFSMSCTMLAFSQACTLQLPVLKSKSNSQHSFALHSLAALVGVSWSEAYVISSGMRSGPNTEEGSLQDVSVLVGLC